MIEDRFKIVRFGKIELDGGFRFGGKWFIKMTRYSACCTSDSTSSSFLPGRYVGVIIKINKRDLEMETA